MEKVKKKSSTVVRTPILSAVALLSAGVTAGCGTSSAPAIGVYLDGGGRCINEATGMVVEQRICYGHRGGYYGGSHYVFIPGRSAPYYSNPGSPGYVKPWGSAGVTSGATAVSSGGTVRGTFGGSAGGGE